MQTLPVSHEATISSISQTVAFATDIGCRILDGWYDLVLPSTARVD